MLFFFGHRFLTAITHLPFFISLSHVFGAK